MKEREEREGGRERKREREKERKEGRGRKRGREEERELYDPLLFLDEDKSLFQNYFIFTDMFDFYNIIFLFILCS